MIPSHRRSSIIKCAMFYKKCMIFDSYFIMLATKPPLLLTDTGSLHTALPSLQHRIDFRLHLFCRMPAGAGAELCLSAADQAGPVLRAAQLPAAAVQNVNVEQASEYSL